MWIILAFLAGLFCGATVGFFVCALLVSGRESNDISGKDSSSEYYPPLS